MFRFLINNPVFLIAILFAIARFFSAIKKSAGGTGTSVRATARQKARQEQQETLRAFRARVAESGTPSDRKMEELLRKLETRTGVQLSPDPAQPVQAPPAGEPKVYAYPEPSAETVSGEAYAFHSLTKQMPNRRDYDRDPGVFDYKPAVRESVDEEYHLRGFAGFQSAHGLSGGKAARPAGEEVYDAAERFDAIQDIIGDGESIRRAIIVSEILGRPVALRRSR